MRFEPLKTCVVIVLLLGTIHVNIVQADQSNVTMPRSNEKQSGCIPVSIFELEKPYGSQHFKIMVPGHYCLTMDIVNTYTWFDKLADIAAQRSSGREFGILYANIELDLKGHKLQDHGASVGIVAVGTINNGLVKNITIRNGTLDLIGSAVVIENTPYSRIYDKPHKVFPKASPSDPYQAARDGYISTQITLENLDITAGESAILLEGNDNIIRNCKIRVKGSNAIQIYGNNVQILNNEIIVESKYAYSDEKKWGKDIGHSMAPIMLRDGDNALISGNKITIKGDEANRPVQAISLRDSRNVRIDNNQFIGAQTIYKAFEAFNAESTATESNNSLKAKAGWFE